MQKLVAVGHVVGALSPGLEQLFEPCVPLEWLWQDRIWSVVKILPSIKLLELSRLPSSYFLLLSSALYRQHMA